MKKKKEHNDCLFISECLESISNFWSGTYTLLVFLSILGGVIVLTNVIGIEIVNWIIGFFALICTILLQLFKERFEKIQGYRELSNEFKILDRSFSRSPNAKKNWDDLDKLTKKLSDYPLSERTKKKIRKGRKKNERE